MENIEDSYRRQQLLGEDSSRISYMIRPINSSSAISNLFKPLYKSASNKTFVIALPIVWQNQYNTDHPYGMNDGSMVPARGYQSQLSAGVFAKMGPLSIQLRPEFVFAENKDYRELHEADNGPDFLDVYAKQFYNKIDMPDRFGGGNYTKALWGQSSIRLTFGGISLGLSNENLWWGPGTRNTLLMSNNAPGFKHLTLNTSKPLKTPIGTFETQVLAGKLDPSREKKLLGSHYTNKRGDWRYLSGIAATYQPKWVPNLYLGLDRSFVIYSKDLKSFGDYIPFFASFTKDSFSNSDETENSEDLKKKDQYVSFFARWVLPQSKAEIYLQFGRNDHSWDLRDAVVEPRHSSAYVAGFRKLVALRSEDEYLQLGLEITQLSVRQRTFRLSPPWYVHHLVRAGYTNMGQVLGAGIGSGSNMQSFDLMWVKGLKRAGVQFERTVQNYDLFSFAFTDPRRTWVDLSFAGKFDFDFKHFIVNSQVVYIRSLNYQYNLAEASVSPRNDQQNANNLHLKFGVLYMF